MSTLYTSIHKKRSKNCLPFISHVQVGTANATSYQLEKKNLQKHKTALMENSKISINIIGTFSTMPRMNRVRLTQSSL